MRAIKRFILSSLRRCGYDLRRLPERSTVPVEFTTAEREIFEYVRAQGLSMVSDERLYATILACRHVVQQGIPGDFVECGVYKGGNAIIAAHLFKAYGAPRQVWLFDTFRGMTAPTDEDRESHSGKPVLEEFQSQARGDHNEWVYCPIEQVQAHFRAAGLLDDRVRFVQGDVLETLVEGQPLPEAVSVLRLDTDWYESTRRELEVLYPRLSTGGVLMIDDYGHFLGAQKATDEYFAAGRARPLLHYIDYTGRVGVKPA